MNKKPILPFVLLCIILSLCSGLADVKYSNYITPSVFVLISTAVLTFFKPENKVLWIIIMSLGILFSHIVASLVGFVIPHAKYPSIFLTLLALIPSVSGAYIGNLLNKRFFSKN